MESLEENQPRPKSPHMNNEEPIELAHYPGAHYPEPGEVPPIDREDFPAPFYAYAVDDIRRRLSHSDVENEGADQVDAASPEQEEAEKKILKAEEVLKKCENTWITQTITADLEEKIKQLKAPRPVDPRSQSRAPNARKPPPFRLRYESAINACKQTTYSIIVCGQKLQSADFRILLDHLLQQQNISGSVMHGQ